MSKDIFYSIGEGIALDEYMEKTAFIGAAFNAFKGTSLAKGLKWMMGMPAYTGSSMTKARLLTPMLGGAVGGGVLNSAMAEEGQKGRAFATGALGGLAFVPLMRAGRFLGSKAARGFNRANTNRYTNMGFDANQSAALINKNEINFLKEQLERGANHSKIIGNYLKTYGNRLDQNTRARVNQLKTQADKFGGRLSADANKSFQELVTESSNLANQAVQSGSAAAQAALKSSGRIKNIGATVGSLGAPMVIPYQSFIDDAANKYVPPNKNIASNNYNSYYGGMR